MRHVLNSLHEISSTCSLHMVFYVSCLSIGLPTCLAYDVNIAFCLFVYTCVCVASTLTLSPLEPKGQSSTLISLPQVSLLTPVPIILLYRGEREIPLFWGVTGAQGKGGGHY